MATLVLSTVGTMLGGPIGGAIGSLLGRSIDQQLLGPGPRQGPRLGDLSVQSSSYGTPIPKVFGTMRVAGSIVWSTDLTESSQTEGAKGQPDSVTYSYSVSFAVALSSRRITSVRRIWADGKLIRTVDGQFTIGTGFRICDGSEDQPTDPLIEAIEGAGQAPAYRGLALAIFEDMELAEFGNRIPFLTFEVVADDGAASVSEILDEVSDGAIASASATTIDGYAAHGATIADSISPLVETLDVALADDGTVLSSPAGDVALVKDQELGCTAGENEVARKERSQVATTSLPSSLSLGYYDPERDYQTGLAQASIEAGFSSVERVEVPAVLDASSAKALAETSLGRRWARRDRLKLRLPPSYLAMAPGALINIEGEPASWRAERVTVDSFAVVADLGPVYTPANLVPADPGRVLASAAAVPEQTDVRLIELPSDGTGEADSPVVAVAASTLGKWRPVPLQVEIGGEAYQVRSASAASVVGTAVTSLGSGQSAMFDLANSVDVELGRDDDWLESRDDDALLAGANAAVVGYEIIQFGSAEPLGNRRFRLSRLLRGRRGTEWAMPLHSSGEALVMLDPSRLLRLPLASAHVGGRVRVTPEGLADGVAGTAELTIAGEAMRPPSPVHLKAWREADGSLRCTWVRRSNRGWAWLDGVDAPLGCSTETYRVTLSGSGGEIELETGAAEVQVSAADLAAAGTGQATLIVVQVGDFAISRAASLTITIS